MVLMEDLKLFRIVLVLGSPRSTSNSPLERSDSLISSSLSGTGLPARFDSKINPKFTEDQHVLINIDKIDRQ